MNLYEKIFKIKEPVKAKGLEPLYQSSSGFFGLENERVISEYDYVKQYKGWAYSAIYTISKSVTNLNYHTVDSKGNQRDSRDLGLINLSLIENIVSYLKLTGVAYIRKHRIGNKVTKLEVLRTDLVNIQYEGDNITVREYHYTLGGTFQIIIPKDVIVIADFDPFRPHLYNTKGYSATRSIIDHLQMEEYAINFNKNWFNNDGTPGLALSSDRSVDAAVKKAYVESWKQQNTGSKNKSKVVFLDEGVKLDVITSSHKDAEFIEQRQFTRDEILAVFGVPKALIGLGEGVNVGNVEAFEMIFQKNVIIPLTRKIADTLNSDSELFNDFYFEFVINLKSIQDSDRNDWLDGVITLNEYRAKRGLAPVADGDRYKSEGTNVIV